MNKSLEKINEILAKEPKLIEIKEAKKVIFVGDTHGDLEASRKIVEDYLQENNKIVFLGDYVDRGLYSKENLNFLIGTKVKNPEKIYLLQGNHEGHRILQFLPAEFWERLSQEEYQQYSLIVEKFPLVCCAKNIIALHAALPDLKQRRPGLRGLEQLNEIKLGSKEWKQIVWGDFVDIEGEVLGVDPFSGRPQFGRDYFEKLMEKFGKKVLIRSHDPHAPQFMFDDRCLTIFTSAAYHRERNIAILDFKKQLKSAKDLEIKTI